MSQSATLVAFIVAAFVLYLAAKGRLPVYTGVLWGPPSQGSPSGGSSGSSSGGGGFDWAEALKIGETLLTAAG